MSLDEFLSEAQSQGTRLSQGEFTVSPEEARRKLREFQLVRKSLFALHLVAAAVAGKADQACFSTTATTLEFSCDGRLPDRFEVSTLFQGIFNMGTPTQLRELAYGVNGALGLRPASVWLETWDGQAGVRLDCRADSTKVVGLQRSWRLGARGLRVLCTFGGRGFSISKVSEPVFRELRSFCHSAPLELTLNGQRCQRPAGSFASVIAFRLHRSQVAMKETLPDELCPGYVEEHAAEGFSASVALTTRDTPELTVLVNGVSYPQEAEVLNCPQARVMIAVDSFQKDLSQAALVQNEALEQLIAWSKEQIEQMIRARCRSAKPVARLARNGFRTLLTSRYPKGKRPAEVMEWLRYDRLLRQAQQPEHFAKLVRAIPQLAEEEVAPLWRDAVSGQQAGLLEAITEGQYESAAEHLQNLSSCPDEFVELPRGLGVVIRALAGCQAADLGVPPTWQPDQEEAWALHRQALALRRVRRYRQAEELHLAADQLPGWSPYFLGELAMVRGNADQAEEQFLLAHKACHDWAFVLDALASLKWLLGLNGEALEWREKALSLRRKDDDRRFWLQRIFRESRAVGGLGGWARWCAASGIAWVRDLSPDDRERHKAFSDRYDWLSLAQTALTKKASSQRWRYYFHLAVWALRGRGLKAQAEELFATRALLAGLDLERAPISLQPLQPNFF